MSKTDSDEREQATVPDPIPGPGKTVRRDFALTGIFVILAIYALYFGREFFMPVILAFLFALTLTPIVRFAGKRGIPAPVSATLLVAASALVVTIGGYLLSGPVMQLVHDAPQIGRDLSERMQELRTPFNRLLAISQQIDEAADTTSDEGVLKVAVQQPGILSQAAGNMLSAGTTIAIVFVLSLFLLASGTLFYEKIVQSFTTMSEKKRALRVVYDVEREVSRYLLTVAVINGGLGVVVCAGLWALGMPTPLLWGGCVSKGKGGEMNRFAVTGRTEAELISGGTHPCARR